MIVTNLQHIFRSPFLNTLLFTQVVTLLPRENDQEKDILRSNAFLSTNET